MRMCMIFSRQSYLKIHNFKTKKKRRYVANFQVLVSLCFTKFRKSIQFLTLWEHDNKQFKNRGSGLVWLVVRRKTVFDLFFIFQNFVKKLFFLFFAWTLKRTNEEWLNIRQSADVKFAKNETKMDFVNYYKNRVSWLMLLLFYENLVNFWKFR